MSGSTRNANPSIALIGAGMCGLTCAHLLQSKGVAATVFEKSRGLGGRLATRRSAEASAFDHGAQFVSARGAAFQETLGKAIAAGSAGVWSPYPRDPLDDSADDWIVGLPGMNSLVKPFAQDVDVRLSAEVTSVHRDAGRWRVCTSILPAGALFDFVVTTVPAPQALTLVGHEPGFGESLEPVSIAPCWALMAAFKEPLHLPFDFARMRDEDLAWFARNNSKPGRDGSRECWVVHAGPSWSFDNLELDRDTAAQKMLGSFATSSGAELPEVREAAAHRWRYALTTNPLGRPFVASKDRTLFVGGDWCLGARVECAFESGQAIAAAVLDRIAG